MKTARDVLQFIDNDLIQRQQLAGPTCMRAVLEPECQEIGREAFRRASVVEALSELRNGIAARIEIEPPTTKAQRARRKKSRL